MSRITHEEAKGYVESIETDGKLYSFECKGLMLYINQQEKQEKLLELYIDLANTLEVLDNAYGYEIFEFSEIKYICNKIKELENE